MNKNTHRLVFNKSCGCMVAVAETASSSNKSPSGTTNTHCKSSKCSKTARRERSTLSNVLPAQWIQAQEAPDLIVFAAKRLGDGFYEQRLVRELVAQLTGLRFLGDYRSDEEQYKALMTSAITYAKAYNLRPGIALSPAQTAQLTRDIVWLVEQIVTLPNGQVVKALVPQVYVLFFRTYALTTSSRPGSHHEQEPLPHRLQQKPRPNDGGG